MEDWNKIRKSDEEFIKGIYEKAKLFQEESIDQVSGLSKLHKKREKKNKLRVTKAVSIGASAAACALVVLSAVKLIPQWNENNTMTNPKNTMYRSMDEPEVAQYSVGDEESPAESEPLEVVGTMGNIIEDSNGIALTVTVENQDATGLGDQVQVILSEDLYQKMQEYQTEHELESFYGTPVILYVETYNWLDYYKVINDDGLYLQQETEDGVILYKNLDGDILKS